MGDIIELPKGATPIDFAYKVHTKVGETMVGAIVNNSIVPIDYELKNNDIVKINTSKNSKGPSQEWLNIAKSSQTKNKIRAFFTKNEKEIYIEREDFRIDADKKFYRLKPEGYVRLKGAYIIKCDSYETDEKGDVKVIYCSIAENSKSGNDTSGIKTKAVIHWVSVKHAVDVKVNIYDYLLVEGDEDKDFSERMNPGSLKVIEKAKAEPFLASAAPQDKFQFLRLGYFNTDYDTVPGRPVFNSIVSLKDSKNK